MPQRADWPEIGVDALDLPAADVERRWGWLPRRRPALGVRATAAPTLFFVLLGAALGPPGANILTRTALSYLESVAWVALAVVGVFLGFGLAWLPRALPWRTLTAGTVVALVTIPAVAVGLYVMAEQASVPLTGNAAAAAMLIALCVSVSAALHTTAAARSELRQAAHLADLDDVPVLVLGVSMVAALAGEAVILRLLATIAAGATIGAAGCLLFEHADEAERGVFLTGSVLLLAGVGAYLGTSPLLSGSVAAVVWVRAPGSADRITAHDLRTLQHPLVALLLIIAGASMEWTPTVLWITAYVVVLRVAAKLLASVLAAPLVRVPPALLASVLLQPGIMGIALGVNAAQMLGDEYRWMLSAIVATVVVSEILAVFLPRSFQDGG